MESSPSRIAQGAVGSRLLAWLTTIPLLIVGTLVGVAFHPVLWLARRGGVGRFDRAVRLLAALEIRLVRMTGTRVEIEHTAELSADRAYVLVTNHQSVIDVLLIASAMKGRSVGFVAKRSLSRGIPSVSLALRDGRHALVDRRNPIQSMVEIRRLGRAASAANASVAIFPEGTRSRDGSLGEFNWAGTLALLRAAPELAVVPVALDGPWIFVRNGLRPIPFGTKIRLRIGEPIEIGEGTSVIAVLAEAERVIASTLEHWRGAP